MNLLKWSEAHSRSQHNMEIYRTANANVKSRVDCASKRVEFREIKTNQEAGGDGRNKIFQSDDEVLKSLRLAVIWITFLAALRKIWQSAQLHQ